MPLPLFSHHAAGKRPRIQRTKTDSTTVRKAIPVSVMEVQPAPFTAYIEVQSQISGDENVNATPQAPGVVKSISVTPGQKVGRGQVLAMLDASAIEPQIKAQDAQISLFKQLYEK